MIKKRHVGTGLCLALMISTVVPRPAYAGDRGQDRPVRLFATEQFSPIGRVYSLGVFVIDGRSEFGEQAIWGGELIQTMAGSRVNVDIDLVGRITLKNGATARLGRALTSRDDATEQHLFVASLVDGDMAVRLQQDAGAYIESSGMAFTSSFGASFVISAREGSPVIDVASGTIKAEPQPPDLTFTGRTVQVVNGIPRPVTGTDTIKTSTKKKVPIAIQFTKSPLKTGSLTKAFSPRLVMLRNQTTQIQIPAAGRRVRLAVEAAVGTIAPTDAVTDANGVVQAEFSAGSDQVNGTITAEVLRAPGDPDRTKYEVYKRTVSVKILPWWQQKRNQLIGAAAITTLIVFVERPHKGPIQQGPPPVVIP